MGVETGVKWSLSKKKNAPYQQSRTILAVKNAILTYTKNKQFDCIHFQMDNTAALPYLPKMGGMKKRV